MFSRSRIQDKQVLVDKDPEVTLNQLDGLNECELVAKANEALVCMSPRLQQQGPAELRAVGAKRLHNGGIIYDKPETTRWVRREKATFMAGFGRTMVVKERAISIIVKFVLIAHSPDVLAANRRIECNSSLREGMLLSTRWIKPVQKHAKGQKVAHLIARLRTNKDANQAIREGMIIASKRTWAIWMQKEPWRCLKCQLITARHLAASCNQKAMCGTCGKGHCTFKCQVTDRAELWCVNCKEKGHASWDRLCLEFWAASRQLEDTDPEHTYKYFPNQDEWMWEQQPGYEHLGPSSGWGAPSGRKYGYDR